MPLYGFEGCAPRVTDMAPLPCVSGTRTTGNIAPGVNASICMAVGSYETCSSAAETVSVSVSNVLARKNVSPVSADFAAGESESFGPESVARLRKSCVFFCTRITTPMLVRSRSRIPMRDNVCFFVYRKRIFADVGAVSCWPAGSIGPSESGVLYIGLRFVIYTS